LPSPFHTVFPETDNVNKNVAIRNTDVSCRCIALKINGLGHYLELHQDFGLLGLWDRGASGPLPHNHAAFPKRHFHVARRVVISGFDLMRAHVSQRVSVQL
jgi:hypothetical protein